MVTSSLCPNCDKKMSHKEGIYGGYMECVCGFKFPDEIWGYKTNPTDLEWLRLFGKTGKKTFRWKNGKVSQACLKFDKKENKLAYEF